MIQFYKPNAKNTGAACSFWYNPQQKAFWASIIRQASWDAKNRSGSFQKNKNIQEKNVKVKLNVNEIGGILDCLENETGEIIMDQETIDKARLSVEKMVAIGR